MPRRGRFSRWRRGEGGQTLVEFALILPIFVILLFALGDFGRAFYSWMIVTNAAREGARAAAVQGDVSTIDSQIYGSFCSVASPPSGCGIGPAGIAISRTNVQGTRGSQASVTVTYAFAFITPIGSMMTLIGGTNFSAPTISSTTSMRLE